MPRKERPFERVPPTRDLGLTSKPSRRRQRSHNRNARHRAHRSESSRSNRESSHPSQGNLIDRSAQGAAPNRFRFSQASRKEPPYPRRPQCQAPFSPTPSHPTHLLDGRISQGEVSLRRQRKPSDEHRPKSQSQHQEALLSARFFRYLELFRSRQIGAA